MNTATLRGFVGPVLLNDEEWTALIRFLGHDDDTWLSRLQALPAGPVDVGGLDGKSHYVWPDAPEKSRVPASILWDLAEIGSQLRKNGNTDWADWLARVTTELERYNAEVAA